RLLAGFGTSIGLLLIAGLLGWFGLQRTNAQSKDTVQGLSNKTEISEQVVTAVLREVIGGLRYLQVYSPDVAQRYELLAREADRVLRSSSADTLLGLRERMVLEQVAARTAALEVRIASTH